MADPSTDWRDQVLAVDEARYRALMASDVDRLDHLLTEDFIYIHNAGFYDDKVAYLGRIRRGDVRYSDWHRVSAQIRIYGSTALMTGHMRMVANLPDQAIQLDNLYLAIWVLIDGDWRLASWASTSRQNAS